MRSRARLQPSLRPSWRTKRAHRSAAGDYGPWSCPCCCGRAYAAIASGACGLLVRVWRRIARRVPDRWPTLRPHGRGSWCEFRVARTGKRHSNSWARLRRPVGQSMLTDVDADSRKGSAFEFEMDERLDLIAGDLAAILLRTPFPSLQRFLHELGFQRTIQDPARARLKCVSSARPHAAGDGD